jgi:hypothetical protein
MAQVGELREFLLGEPTGRRGQCKLQEHGLTLLQTALPVSKH